MHPPQHKDVPSFPRLEYYSWCVISSRECASLVESYNRCRESTDAILAVMAWDEMDDEDLVLIASCSDGTAACHFVSPNARTGSIHSPLSQWGTRKVTVVGSVICYVAYHALGALVSGTHHFLCRFARTDMGRRHAHEATLFRGRH